MYTKKVLGVISLLALVVSLVFLLSACGGGDTEPADTSSGGTTDSGSDDTGTEEETVLPTATLAPEELFPEELFLHPDAYDIEVTEASGMYVYLVPGMVKEITEYLLDEQLSLGWEKLGNPTIMGHLATLNLKMDSDRLTISLQDNELSESTRVQMLLMQQ